MTAKEKQVELELQKLQGLQDQVQGCLKSYCDIRDDLNNKSKELDKAIKTLEDEKAVFKKQESAVIKASKELNVAQKQVIEDQKKLDSMIKRQISLTEEAEKRATQAKDVEDQVIEGMVQSRLNKMMKEAK